MNNPIKLLVGIFIIVLASACGGGGGGGTPPDPLAGTLQFSAVTYSGNEDAGSVTITVNRVNGTSGDASVVYATSNGTADDSDYTSASGTLSWAAGEGGAKTFTVPITDDTQVEADETINLTLSNATGASLGTPGTATLTIKYNDTNLTMNIGDGSYWVAFQNGLSGVWAEWSPTIDNIYNFPVTDMDGRYGVAFHRQETDGFSTVEKTYVIHATLAELSSLNAFQNTQYTVSGTLRNYTDSNNSAGVIMYVRGFGGEPLALPADYTIPRVPTGNRDLLAFEWINGNAPSRFVIQRDINITGDLTGQDVDFSTQGENFTATPHNYSGNDGGELLELYYSTANGTPFMILEGTYIDTPLEYAYLTNSSLVQTGDSYSFQVSDDLGSKYRVRNFAAVDGSPGDRTIGLNNLGALSGTAVNANQTSGLSYTPNPASLNGLPVFRGFQIDLDQSNVNNAHWQIKISADWLGTATSYTHPDLLGVSGYQAAWDMGNGVSTSATVSTATTQDGRGGFGLVTRLTIGPNSNKLDPESWVVAKKLAQDDRLRLDIARQFSTITW